MPAELVVPVEDLIFLSLIWALKLFGHGDLVATGDWLVLGLAVLLLLRCTLLLLLLSVAVTIVVASRSLMLVPGDEALHVKHVGVRLGIDIE
jgi:hypothetical protein